MGARSFLTNVAKKSPALRAVMRGARLTLSRASYRRCVRKTEPDERLVLFESYGGRSYACSPRALYEAMLADSRFDGFRFVWAFEHPEQKALPDTRRTTTVTSGSAEYYKTCAAARLIVINSSFPERVTLRNGQSLLETWHGTPLKRLGFDITADGGGDALNGVRDNRRRYRLNAERFTWLLSPSPYCTEKLTSAFGLSAERAEEIIVEKGYPRNDRLFSFTEDEAEEIRRSLGIPENKKILLYAPTYRDNSHTSGVGYTYECPVDFERLQKTLGDGWVVLFRAHYFVANSFDFSKYSGFVYDVSGVDDVNDLYIISDALVTDYSSVFFDYANLGRPMLFYVYDREQYEQEVRGFYFDYSELPGPIAYTQEQLERELLDIVGYDERYAAARAKFRERFSPLEDGHASERVLDVISGCIRSDA